MATVPKEIRFTEQPPFSFRVRDIEIAQPYHAPMADPHIEHRMPVSPAQAVRAWAQDRLRAAGGDATLKLEIAEASAITRPLPREKGFKASFKVQQAEEVQTKLAVTLKLYADSPLPVAEAHAMATQSITIPENATLQQRDEILYRLVKDLSAKLDAELDRNIRQYLIRYTN